MQAPAVHAFAGPEIRRAEWRFLRVAIAGVVVFFSGVGLFVWGYNLGYLDGYANGNQYSDGVNEELSKRYRAGFHDGQAAKREPD